jgi:hypothetical protein
VKAVTSKAVLLAAVLLSATWLCAGDKDKTAKLESKVVDSGSFGIYVGGKRIGTETFKIEQHPDFSVATAEIKVDDGTVKAVQTAEMQITPKGDLHSYVWRATLPAKEEASVEPNDQLLIEHIIPADLKKVDIPHVLPLSTVILDDNFFSQREILLWRYLATGCVPNKDGNRTCGTSSFPALVPRQHMSINATLSVIGPDKVTLKGSVREMTKVSLQLGEPQQLIMMNSSKEAPGQWFLWVDDQYKVIKIAVPDSNIEVIRD